MTNYIFQEPEKGYVAHTAASMALIAVPKLDKYLEMICSELWPTATTVTALTLSCGYLTLCTYTDIDLAFKLVDAMIKWPKSEEPTETVG